MRSLIELRMHADAQLFAGDYDEALHAFTTLVSLQPNDLDARMRIADTLLAMGEVQEAAVVYTTLARHAAHAGYPLRALVAMKVLEALEPQLGALLTGLAELYALDSPRLGRAIRHSLATLEVPLPGDWDPAPPARAALVARAVAEGKAVERINVPYPERLPPIPLFSELPADAFAAVLAALKLRRARPGEAILVQGEVGQSFYVVARGSVSVCRAEESGSETQLATLHDGAIFGEMALVSEQPRSAHVRAIGDVDLLEFDREALAAASSSVATIAQALDKFTRERLLNNLLATAALFHPLDRRQRIDLARRFTAHDVQPGTAIIQQGQPGRGLFVLMNGKVEVWRREGNTEVRLAVLTPGAVFGEISLLNDEPTTASVRATSKASVLFLAREYFQRLVQAIPAIQSYVEDLGAERLMDTQLAMADDPTSWDDSPTLVDPVDKDDLIMV